MGMTCDILPGPGVHTRHLEAIVPGTRILSLTLGSGADSMTMGLAILPTSTEGATVIKVKPATTDTRGSYGGS